MIEINLLPGGGRKKAVTTRASIDFAALFAGFATKLGDPVMIGAVATIAISVMAFAWMYVAQPSQETAADEREKKVTTKQYTYSSAAGKRIKLGGNRDGLLRQINLINSIDDDRYIWPHVLDEISRALPPYVWVTHVIPSGAGVGLANVVAAPKPPPRDPSAKVTMVTLYGFGTLRGVPITAQQVVLAREAGTDIVADSIPSIEIKPLIVPLRRLIDGSVVRDRDVLQILRLTDTPPIGVMDTIRTPAVLYRPKDGKVTVPKNLVMRLVNAGWRKTPTVIPREDVAFRITGRTVTIEALTNFMKVLAQSPYFTEVDLQPVTPGNDPTGKETSLFTLLVKYRRPDSTGVRRLPLAMTVR